DSLLRPGAHGHARCRYAACAPPTPASGDDHARHVYGGEQLAGSSQREKSNVHCAVHCSVPAPLSHKVPQSSRSRSAPSHCSSPSTTPLPHTALAVATGVGVSAEVGVSAGVGVRPVAVGPVPVTVTVGVGVSVGVGVAVAVWRLARE